MAPGAAAAEAYTESERAGEADCDPLAWLAALFAGIGNAVADDGGGGAGASEETSDVTTAGAVVPGLEATGSGTPPLAAGPVVGSGSAEDGAASSSMAQGSPGDESSTDGASPEAAPPLPAASVAVGDDPSGAGLRAPEVIGRVWIAPFVDAGGIYREAHWVRVVMAPAAWRLR